jgi:hypothetical protein
MNPRTALKTAFVVLAAAIFATTTLWTAAARAQAGESANTTSKHNLLFNFGWVAGGLALGADYENNSNKTFGLGTYLRLYDGNNDPFRGDFTTAGVFIRPHFTRQGWDFYLSPGFGFVKEEIVNNNNNSGRSDETYFGPSFAIGLMYQINYNVAIGVENFQIYGWFGDDQVLGQRSDELLAKFRYSF